VSVYFGRKGKGGSLIYNMKNKGFYYGENQVFVPHPTGVLTSRTTFQLSPEINNTGFKTTLSSINFHLLKSFLRF
jgi:hypothetical protein